MHVLHIDILCILCVLCILCLFWASLHASKIRQDMVFILPPGIFEGVFQLRMDNIWFCKLLLLFKIRTMTDAGMHVFCTNTMMHHTPLWACLPSLWTWVILWHPATAAGKKKLGITIYYAYYRYYAYFAYIIIRMHIMHIMYISHTPHIFGSEQGSAGHSAYSSVQQHHSCLSEGNCIGPIARTWCLSTPWHLWWLVSAEDG